MCKQSSSDLVPADKKSSEQGGGAGFHLLLASEVSILVLWCLYLRAKVHDLPSRWEAKNVSQLTIKVVRR